MLAFGPASICQGRQHLLCSFLAVSEISIFVRQVSKHPHGIQLLAALGTLDFHGLLINHELFVETAVLVDFPWLRKRARASSGAFLKRTGKFCHVVVVAVMSFSCLLGDRGLRTARPLPTFGPPRESRCRCVLLGVVPKMDIAGTRRRD